MGETYYNSAEIQIQDAKPSQVMLSPKKASLLFFPSAARRKTPLPWLQPAVSPHKPRGFFFFYLPLREPGCTGGEKFFSVAEGRRQLGVC